MEYVQLAHNERVNGKSRVKVIHGFGRKDRLDTDALKRLIGSMTRFLEPEDGASVRQGLGLEAAFEFLGAKEYGDTYLLDGLWERLGIAGMLKKRAAEAWIKDVAFIEGLPEVEAQQLYRAMDFLLEAHDDIQREVFWSVKNLFNLEVDLIFVDTTSTYFEIEGEDLEADDFGDDDADTGPGLQKRGHSKD